MVPGTVKDQITLYDPRISDQQVKAVTEPELLLLDEITANLDAETEKMVLQALRRAAEHRTVISVSHRTSAELGRTSGEYSIGGSYNLVQGNSRL